jgi:UDP-N-acetylmuramate--alanine ligase
MAIMNSSLTRSDSLPQGLPLNSGLTYSIDREADAVAQNIRIENGDFYFDYNSADHNIANIRMGIAGIHNIENAVAAIEVVMSMDIPENAVKDALASFKGVKRRFEYVIKNDRQIFIDDYAHHPEELRACIASVKKLYPNKKLTTVFQPHLFTRTRDFADEFALALDATDELLMLDIYPARELPIDGVDAELILNKMQLALKGKYSRQQAIDKVIKEQPELLLTVGAGDIDKMVEPLKQALNHV